MRMGVRGRDGKRHGSDGRGGCLRGLDMTGRDSAVL